MIEIIELSVHQLVDFVLRTGSIDSRVNNSTTMNEGVALHKYHQKKQGSNYESEVRLSGSIEFNDYIFNLSGRCDGILNEENLVTIEEIKSTILPLDACFKENENWHLGQAECYAYLYCLEKNLTKINVQLTYISQIDKRKTFNKLYSYKVDELKAKVFSYLSLYIDFLKVVQKQNELKFKSLIKFEFPFENYRSGQKKMIEFCQKVIEKKSIAFVEAPTGIGKTSAVLYSTLNSLKNKKIDKFFYLASKNSGFFIALDTFRFFIEKGLRIKCVNILAKEKMCLCEEQKCYPEMCPFARQYYEKLNNALKVLLLNYDVIDENVLKDIAWKFQICPFELSLDVSLYCDYIVCDYNYIFHPVSKLERFFESPDKQYKLFILGDEVHNLVSRSRDMYSAKLSVKSYNSCKKEFKNIEDKDVKRALSKVGSYLQVFKNFDMEDDEGNLKTDIVLNDIDKDFINSLDSLSIKLKKFSEDKPKLVTKPIENFSREIHLFLKIFQIINSNFKIYVHKSDEETYLKIFCLDASNLLNDTISSTNGSIFFSATISPIEYYENLILGNKKSDFLELKSPFDPKNFNLMINNKISVLFKDREKTLPNVLSQIDIFTNSKIGNYLVFVPSYKYLRLIKDNLKRKHDVTYLFERSEMKVKEKTEFLEKFKVNPTKTCIGFAVLGGNFYEGIDLTGDKLIGVVVIGIGLPTFDFENQLLSEYYALKGYNSMAYTYNYPGINKVMQAVGRLIRTENDIGSALLIDTRYLYPINFDTYKKVRNNYKIVNNDDTLVKTLNFFLDY